MTKKCPKCGAENEDDATFCSKCKAPLEPVERFAVPTTKKPVPSVKVVSPITKPLPSAPVRVPPPGMCFYHSNLPAVAVCSRCGRSICRDCAKQIGGLILCPQCYAGVAPIVPAPTPTSPAISPINLISMALSLAAGALVVSQGILWNSEAPPNTLFATIGLVLGVVVVLGAFLIYNPRYMAAGSVLVTTCSIASFYIGGGFWIGLTLGVIGGILGVYASVLPK